MEEIKIEGIGEILKNRIKGYDQKIETAEVGTVISVGDGIPVFMAWINLWLESLLSSKAV